MMYHEYMAQEHAKDLRRAAEQHRLANEARAEQRKPSPNMRKHLLALVTRIALL